jgi:hypothetical protein
MISAPHPSNGGFGMQDETGTLRDRLLTTLAVLMGLLALSNFWKPVAQHFDPGGSAGFVFFGTRLQGGSNAVAGPLCGLLLAAYAYGVWTMRRWVVPIACLYAAYVIANLVLFMLNAPPAEKPSTIGMLAYAAVAIGVSSGAAYALVQQRHRLR